MFNLFRYRFLRASFLVSIGFVLLLPVYLTHVTLPRFTALILEETEMEARRIGSHLSSYLEEVPLHADGENAFPALFMVEKNRVMENFGLHKFRLFSRNGEILLSSDSGEINTLHDHVYFFEMVARGQVYSKVVQKHHQTREGTLSRLDVVESYIPIMKQGRFAGAFEIYLDITRPMERMNATLWQSSWILLVGAGGLLLFMLLVRRSVVRSIAMFSTTMENMARGERNQRLPDLGRDELGMMARIFNQMCAALQYTEEGLKREREKLTTILLGCREGIVVTQKDGSVALVNPAAERLLGKDSDRIRQEGFLRLLDDPDYVQACLEKGVDMPETVLFNERVLHFYASRITYDNGEEMGRAALLRDVTEQYRLENELRHISMIDDLTGLFNRRRTDEILAEERERALRYGMAFGLLMLDVDHFKQFNDRYGHDQGDRVLQAVATAMKDHFRNVDFCCRYGGEEFCVILPNTSERGCFNAAERFRQRIAEMAVDGLRVTISIGLAIFPVGDDHQEEVASLMRRADVAMYAAKGQGRNRVCSYSAKMNQNQPIQYHAIHEGMGLCRN